MKAKNDWPVKKLGELLKLCDSGTWGEESQDGFPLLRSTNMQDGRLVLDDLKIIDVSPQNKEKFTLLEGDILITKSSGSETHIGKSLYIDKRISGKYGFSNFTQRIRTNRDIVEPLYIYFILSAPFSRQTLLNASRTTSGLRNLSIPALKDFDIKVPSIKIQKKIVERLVAIRKALELCDAQIQKTEELFESALLREVSINEGKITLRSLIKLSSGKFMPSKNQTPGGKVPVYGGNGVNGFTDTALVSSPTIVIGRVGAYCGNVHFVEFSSWVSDNAMYVKEIKNDQLNLKFLYYFFKIYNLHKFAGFSGQPKITQEPILNVELNLPSLIQQQKIVEKLEAVENYKKLLVKQKSLLQELFDSVLDKSMKGEMD